MIPKWITIIKNWINCYSAENDNNEQTVTLESLLNLISHLRENLNLDESKSSTLEAHSVDEFIREKYPEFRFENGTLEASAQEDLYMAASLLLLFVCVNSKDIDMKTVMCRQLNVEDQEVILKFSTFLMECSPIKLGDVKAAIKDACSPVIGVADLDRSCSSVVSETPPALRSLHGEVRRLQAALEAERFDRNYLQEELSRTNLKLDKLSKGNEDYKQDIIKLKAKISMCCGHENNVKSDDNAVERTAKLMRELEMTEERLVTTQSQLEDALYEKDTYRTKVNELKHERDKWLTLSQQQTELASQLSEELEGERQTTHSLRELVAELRQHNQLTRLDSSQIECDDPNASIHSFQHNASFCSEACANVVEVQLGEERAKLEVLKQQNLLLQEQLQNLSQKHETEKLSYEKCLSDKDDDIFNLKHRINEEIEVNNNMTIHYSDAFNKLNNDVNELEQKLKDANVQSRIVIEIKMQEIQTLQEEKLSLLQSLHDETTKLDRIIKNLESELTYERNTKAKQKEDYENHIMKLNEKVLNRNNELVELQNNVFEKSEKIEELNLAIRNEKQAKQKDMEWYHREVDVLNKRKLDAENNLLEKNSEIELLTQRWKQKCNEVEVQLGEERAKLELLKKQNFALQEQIKEMSQKHEAEKLSFEKCLSERNDDIINLKHRINEEIQVNNNMKLHYSDAIKKVNNNVNELEQKLKDANVQSRIVIEMKTQEIQTLQEEKLSLLQSLHDETTKLDTIIKNLDSELEHERNSKETQREDYESHIMKLNEKVLTQNSELVELQKNISENNKKIKELNLEIGNEQQLKQKIIKESQNELEVLNKRKLDAENNLLEKNSELELLTERWKQKSNEVEVQLGEERAKLELLKKQNLALQEQIQEMSQKHEIEKLSLEKCLSEKDDDIIKVKHRINEEIQVNSNMKIQYSDTIKKINNDVNELEQKLKDANAQSRIVIEMKTQEIQTLQEEKLSLLQSLHDETIKLDRIIKNLERELELERNSKETQKKDYESHIMKLNEKVLTQNSELVELQKNFSENNKKIKELNLEIGNEQQLKQNIIKESQNQLEVLNKRKLNAENNLLEKNSELELLTERWKQKSNEVEVQLGEERAKLELLKKQNLAVQEQIQEMSQKHEIEKLSLEKCLSEKDDDLIKVKHRINDEIQVNSNMKIHHSDAIKKINNDVNELEQKLKDANVQSRIVIEMKMQEIQTLQEEKLSLLQSLHVETTKLDRIIKNLESELEHERNSKEKQKQDYENHIMKLNENVLTRNNELVELQNNVSENIQKIKELNLEIGNEKQAKQKMIKEYQNELEVLKKRKLDAENNLLEKNSEIELLTKRLKRNSNEVEVQLGEERAKIEELNQQSLSLQEQLQEMSQKHEAVKLSLEKSLSDKDHVILNLKHHINQEIEVNNNMKIHYSDAFKKVNNDVNELEQKLKDANIQSRIVIEIKMQEIQTLQQEKLSLLHSLHDETTKLDRLIKNLESELEQERNSKEKQKEDYENHIMKLNENVLTRNNELVELQNNVSENNKKIKELNLEIGNEQQAKQTMIKEYQNELEVLNKRKLNAENNLLEKKSEIELLTERLKRNSNEVEVQLGEERAKIEELNQQSLSLQEQLQKISQKHEDEKLSLEKCLSDKDHVIFDLKRHINQEIEVNNNMKIHYSDAFKKVNNDVNELEQKLKDANIQSRIVIETKMQEIQTLQEEKLSLLHSLHEETAKLDRVKNKLESVLKQERNSKEKQKEDYENHIMNLNEKLLIRNNELLKLQNNVSETSKKIRELNLDIENEKQAKQRMIKEYQNELEVLNKRELDAKNYLLEKDSVLELVTEKLKQSSIHNEKLNNEIGILRNCIVKLERACSDLEESKVLLLNEIRNKDNKLLEQDREIDDLTNKYRCEAENCQKQKDKYESKIALLAEEINKAREDAAISSERVRSLKYSGVSEKDCRDRDSHQQVDYTTSDLAHSSIESNKTISDLEKIICDKNRTITLLQTDITYLKTMIADSENKILDFTKEREISDENNQQLSSQLKKIVCQKNDEIAELKRYIAKMSATENRASQIIKVSAKYQAIILKRIAEIKTNTVLKELTNFGNTNGDNELRRSLNAGTVTMEDLENFLETTDKHLRRCSEKQIALQKDRDRLSEVNRINESEIINMRKFLTELSVSFQTFNSIKDLYTQKLTRVVSMQRTVRRELLTLDGRVGDSCMFKLERSYTAVMQDLTECVMNMERWVERSIGRKISSEKIKQAFMSDDERSSLASTTFQNTSLEVQLEELENAFKKLLEDILRAQRDGGAKETQAATIMELRVEYEDKLNRMKAKMKELYMEQIESCMAKQKKVIDSLECELAETKEKLKVTSKAYEDHIRGLATDLWNVSEKFLATKDELGWLQKKQRSGSLMSLQHVHSAGLQPRNEEQPRVSDAASLRSLPVHNDTKKREGRGLHMSDEEGEVFDNRWLHELARTPRAGPAPRMSELARTPRAGPGPRLSELRRRNSLCPPHLKSSYPAETQFAPALDEEDIKCVGPAGSLGGRNPRKEVGITAYKKPGPPTPSKQAGRLSATDSELRESLRLEPDASASRKTSTPSRFRSLFRSNKSESTDGTPRSRRTSIFRKK